MHIIMPVHDMNQWPMIEGEKLGPPPLRKMIHPYFTCKFHIFST